MAVGKKRQGGQTKARTVLKLLPVRYRVSLCYLGHERIANDDSDYRCRYKLEPGATPDGRAFDAHDVKLIPNIVKGDTKDEDAKKAATPFEESGDNTNVPAADEKIYRVMVLDNHGMRSADVGLLGQTPGDTESKVANYKKTGGGKRDWMPDVSPAVPFRIVVRKYFGDAQADFDKPHKAIVQLKDSVEEAATYSAARPAVKTFLEKFFKEHNRTKADPNAGDDNCPDTYKGKRQANAGNPGVKAVDVLKKAPYKSKPVTDIPPTDPAVTVAFSELTAATAQGNTNAEFTFDVVEEKGYKVGVADLAFLPYPANGDNYRFLIWLVDSGGQDVRDTLENGRKVELADYRGDIIPKPRVITTGRFVMWRRHEIKLCVLVNRTSKTDINFGQVVESYRRSFIDMIPPDPKDGFFNLTPQQWLVELKNVFTADTAALDALFTSPPPNDLEQIYKREFFPKPLTDKYVDGGAAAGGKVQFAGGGLNGQIFNMASRIIEHACDKLNLEFPGSTDGKKQDTVVRQKKSEGFYVVLMHNPSPTSNLLGESAGDRMFWFCVVASPATSDLAITTQTFQHEMGHAQYLRHSYTSGTVDGGGGGGDRGIWHAAPPATGPAPAPVNIRLFGGHPDNNNQIIDHDQADAYDCTMSYTCSRLAFPIPDFCGLCMLTLRFFDRVEVQKGANHGNKVMEGLSPLTIVRATFTAPNTWTLHEPPAGGSGPQLPNLAVGSEIFVMCVGKEYEPTTNGTQRKARANVTISPTGSPTQFWSQSGAGSVSITEHGTHFIKVKGVTAGAVTLTYTRAGMTATANVTVTP